MLKEQRPSGSAPAVTGSRTLSTDTQSQPYQRQLVLTLLDSGQEEDEKFLDRLISGHGQAPTRLEGPQLCGSEEDIDRPAFVPQHQQEALELTDGPQRAARPSRKASGRTLAPIYLDKGSEKSQSRVLRRHRRPLAFGWYGGKYSHLEWLLPLLPESHHYCEPFAGSAAVLINRDPAPVETYNDIDGELVNFFQVLRDDPEELIRAIALTPFSREEFHQAINDSPQSTERTERARRFYVRARQARTGLAQTATLGRWANCKNTSRAGMSGVISRWFGGVEMLADIAARLLRVQIENRPAIDVIRLYDSPRTLFYCDPPYLHESRGDSNAYGFELNERDHRELAMVLRKIQGRAAISGYRCTLMDELYKEWRRFDAVEKHCHSIKRLRQESLWMNY